MSPDSLFQIANPIALLGWVALICAPFAPRTADLIAALIIPLLMAVGYTALMLVQWSTAPGGYDTLANVMALFTTPAIALAGWLHYLAFDLFLGAWITRTARAEAIAHLFVLPCLVLTFLFGPAGFLAFNALRAVWAAQARMTRVPA
jgi:hypothetical protein